MFVIFKYFIIANVTYENNVIIYSYLDTYR